MTDRVNRTIATTSQSKGTVLFRLQYERAQQVFLIGTFNNWSTTATPMERAGEDVWEAAVALPPGNHEYCYFVIDQAWFTPTPGVTLTPTVVVNSGSSVSVPLAKSGSPLHSLN